MRTTARESIRTTRGLRLAQPEQSRAAPQGPSRRRGAATTRPAARKEPEEMPMSGAKQKAAAKRNVKKAAAAAKRKKSISHLSKATRTALGKQGAKVAQQHRAQR